HNSRMYNIKLHSNRTLFVVALGAGLAAVIYFPQAFPDKIVEMPLAALYLGEAGLALMAALLFYENASISQVIRLAAWVLGFSMAVGATGNFVGQHTQLLSDSVVLM